ncbi:hypothetical protein WJX72_003719 [[Myrmecia] bisecta]|uniref:aminodeoxychorismate synthase n=1 Tax=[Myrmecia] bisecta TaxID=41462 RepID=A0AAW1Q6X6_9CHLO
MGIVHRQLPLYGVQFHPESIGTSYGRRLLANFRDLTYARQGRSAEQAPGDGAPSNGPFADGVLAPTGQPHVGAAASLDVQWRLLTGMLAKLGGSQALFELLYGATSAADTFWLDSSATDRGRFSYMGASQLPFDFWGGYVGYLGYELKAECGGQARHASPTPDAALFLADRIVAVDHHSSDVYLMSMYGADSAEQMAAAESWLLATQQRLEAHVSTSSASQLKPKSAAKALRDGESYEVCLTTALVRPQAPDPFTFYQTLRSLNPAPYAAWLSFGSNGPQVCCSSPERFLCGRRGGGVEARPIKGTAPRSPDPHQDAARSQALAASEKDRAENLMIVDLLRNDLGRVCQVGSVHVPDLMEVESFATVHQLVSTVRGQRRPDASVVDCLRAAFPGGSMTGAPKIRTMDIIDRLENGARGVYSGSVGFIGFNDTFDMNIVIRTAIFCNGEMRIGAGGAIVAQSDIAGEYDEMRLKAKALLHAVGICDAAVAPSAPCLAVILAGDAVRCRLRDSHRLAAQSSIIRQTNYKLSKLPSAKETEPWLSLHLFTSPGCCPRAAAVCSVSGHGT